MQVKTGLPNQTTTWSQLSKHVEEFSDWRSRTALNCAGEDAELLMYLTDQLRRESTTEGSVHTVVGLLSYMGAYNNRMNELMYAYLSLTVAGNSEPAKKLVAGQRLTTCLHPEYVALTNCYGFN